MNYRGKHKKFQTGGPKIDPKVVEQMNKYMSGNNGDIQSRFALDTRVAIANDPVKIKERKKREYQEELPESQKSSKSQIIRRQRAPNAC